MFDTSSLWIIIVRIFAVPNKLHVALLADATGTNWNEVMLSMESIGSIS